MSELPPKDLLEKMHAFPGKFVFKAIGKSEDDFAQRVVAVVRSALQHEFDPPHEIRTTSGGRHTAVTIEPWVESSAQVIDVFAAIRDLEGLVMLM